MTTTGYYAFCPSCRQYVHITAMSLEEALMGPAMPVTCQHKDGGIWLMIPVRTRKELTIALAKVC